MTLTGSMSLMAYLVSAVATSGATVSCLDTLYLRHCYRNQTERYSTDQAMYVTCNNERKELDVRTLPCTSLKKVTRHSESDDIKTNRPVPITNAASTVEQACE